jgi:holo-[acyl-carrier protein] synthase
MDERALGVGVDVLDPERLRAALARRPRLADRLFTAAELDYAARRGDPVKHLAARFCAKEAATKALALDAFEPLEIEVRGTGGRPHVALSGAAARRAGELGAELHVSLAHDESVAVAFSLAAPRSGR